MSIPNGKKASARKNFRAPEAHMPLFCTRRAKTARSALGAGKFFRLLELRRYIGRDDELCYAFPARHRLRRLAVVVQGDFYLAAVIAVDHAHFIGGGQSLL